MGRLYLASVLNLTARRIPGFSLGEHHAAELAAGARKMAAAGRGGDVRGVIFHTDKRSELTVTLFSKVCAFRGDQVDGASRLVLRHGGDRELAFDARVRAVVASPLLSEGTGAQSRCPLDRPRQHDSTSQHARCAHRSSTGRSPPNETPGRRRPREPSARIVLVARKYIGWYHGGER